MRARDIMTRPVARFEPATSVREAIASQVRGLFSDCTGRLELWSVSVTGGLVTVRGKFSDEAERRLGTALAKTVEGVTAVRLAAAFGVDLEEG
ncbi:hypothetical protein [Amycolatopsis sp. NPDC051903]|uniref:hypothetical protein n=1 Tax=Amycolatopsis sp. NPDC051903 TaxID=3363936 RepID=UPI0037AD5C85